jgi:tetratricopeptide (TPR) repeat protein
VRRVIELRVRPKTRTWLVSLVRAAAHGAVLLSLGSIVAAEHAAAPAEAVPAPSGTRAEDALKPRGPLPPPGYLAACLDLIKQGRYAEARQQLQPVVADHPGWARAHFYLGLTYHRENRYAEAAELFHRALELDPLYHEPRVFHGWALYYLGRLDEARRAFESYLAAVPDYPDAIFALGLIDFDADDLESARRRFLRTIELAQTRQDAPTEAKARARLADVHVRLDQWDKAREELERSIALAPDNHEPYFKLSFVLQRLGDAAGADRARAMHRKALESKRASR